MEGTGWDAFVLCWAIVMGIATGLALTAIYYRAKSEGMEAENERLREALRPFALVSREFCVLRDDEGITLEPPPARGCDDLVVCVSRFRRAAEALGGDAS